MTISRRMAYLEQLFAQGAELPVIDDDSTAANIVWSGSKLNEEFSLKASLNSSVSFTALSVAGLDIVAELASKADADHNHDGVYAPATHTHTFAQVPGLQAALDAKLDDSQLGVANGIATLDVTGKVPAAQLPAFVDDVIEVANFASLPATGESGKIYVTLDNGKTFRWGGSAYAEISAAPGSTDAVPEGATNLYYTLARVRAATLTGLVGTAGVIGAADTILVALGKAKQGIADNATAITSKVSFTDNAHAWGAGNIALAYDSVHVGQPGKGFGAFFSSMDAAGTGGFYLANYAEDVWFQISKLAADAEFNWRGSHGHKFQRYVMVPDEAYGATWSTSLQVPTKKAIYDKIESMVLAGGGISDGDKGDVVVSGSGSSLIVESATPSDGSFEVAGNVVINSPGITNEHALTINNGGNGTGGISYTTLVGGGFTLGDLSGAYGDVSLYSANRSFAFNVANNAYAPTCPYAFIFTQSSAAGREVIRIQNLDAGATGDFIVAKDSAGTTKWRVSAAGVITADGSGLTGLTKAQVGLGNVDNTSDANKPVSTAQLTAINARIAATEKGAANGVATLDASGLVPSNQLPSFVDDVLEYANLAAFPGTGVTGKIYIAADTSFSYRWTGTVYAQIIANSGTLPWGSITGTLSNQTDLQTALNGKLANTGGTVTNNITMLGGVVIGKDAGNTTEYGRVTWGVNGAYLRGSKINFQDVAGAQLATVQADGRFDCQSVILDGSNANHILMKFTGTVPTVMHRSDGSNYYILLSNANAAASGTFNALRPFSISLTTGSVSMANGLQLTGGFTVDSITASGSTHYFGTTNGVLVQHTSGTGYVRTQTGDLWLGAGGNNRVKIQAADGKLITNDGMNITGGGLSVTGAGTVALNATTITGNLTLNGDITSSRGDGTGVIFLGGGSKYLYYDNTQYVMPGAALLLSGGGITASGAADFLTPNSGTSGGVRIRANGTTANCYLQFTNNAANSEYGNLKVVATNAQMTWSGAFTAVTVTGTSDERLKQNIRTVEGALDKVAQMRGVHFEWKEDGRASSGVIAQEHQRVAPEAVSEDDEGTLSVNDAATTAYLIEAIKELKGIVEAQAARISELEAR